MSEDFNISRLRRITNALFVMDSSVNRPGLMSGKIGLACYYFHLSRITGNDLYSHFAEKLINESTVLLYEGMSLDFEDGLAGIGWAIGYLAGNKFIEADTDDVLEDFDAAISEAVAQCSILPSSTLLGFAFYYYSRIEWRHIKYDSAIIYNIKRNAGLVIKELDKRMSINIDLPIEEFDFAWTFPWYLWVKKKLSDKGVLEITSSIRARLIDAIKKIMESTLSPANKCFLGLIAETVALYDSSKIDYSPFIELRSPILKDGLAGAIVLLKISRNNGAGIQYVLNALKLRLEGYHDDCVSPAGYPINTSSEKSPAGLIYGIAGIGMGLII